MNDNISKFYAAVIADTKLKSEFESILNGKDITEITDEQLEQLGKLSKKTGHEISIAEAKNFIKQGEFQLSDDDLDAVAGGANKCETICKGEGAGVIHETRVTKS